MKKFMKNNQNLTGSAAKAVTAKQTTTKLVLSARAAIARREANKLALGGLASELGGIMGYEKYRRMITREIINATIRAVKSLRRSMKVKNDSGLSWEHIAEMAKQKSADPVIKARLRDFWEAYRMFLTVSKCQN